MDAIDKGTRKEERERNQEDGPLILNEQPDLGNGGGRQATVIVRRQRKGLPLRLKLRYFLWPGNLGGGKWRLRCSAHKR